MVSSETICHARALILQYGLVDQCTTNIFPTPVLLVYDDDDDDDDDDDNDELHLIYCHDTPFIFPLTIIILI